MLGNVDCSQNIHHQVIWPHLANHEILLQSCVRWQIWGAEQSHCTYIGFWRSALSREDGIWRKRTPKFSYMHIAVDISLCQASCCAEQPPVSMGGSDLHYRSRKEKGCIGRKQESIFESGTWTCIWCNQQSTNFVFRQIIYWLRRKQIFLISF